MPTLFCHLFQSVIALGRSNWLYPVNFCWSVNTGVPSVEVRRKTLLMSFSLLFPQGPAYPPRPTWLVCEIGGEWLYNCCFVARCSQDLFKTALMRFSYLALSPGVSFGFKRCNYTVVLIQVQLRRIPISFYCRDKISI